MSDESSRASLLKYKSKVTVKWIGGYLFNILVVDKILFEERRTSKKRDWCRFGKSILQGIFKEL